MTGIAVQVAPVPPLPPMPGTSMTVGGTLSDQEIVLIVLAALATAVVILWPLVRAFARRLEGRGAAAELEGEVAALHGRVDQLEQSQGHLAELEERLDFAERLLAQTREPDRLQR